jgi:hypothetical protein
VLQNAIGEKMDKEKQREILLKYKDHPGIIVDMLKLIKITEQNEKSPSNRRDKPQKP